MDYGGSYQCFDFFFPGAGKIKHDLENKGISLSDKANVFKDIRPSSYEDSEAEACAMMHFSYKYNNTNSQNFVFKSEITVKNNNLGLSLWTVEEYIRNNPSVTNQIVYFLLFLENEGGTWSTKGGYSWNDSKVYRNSDRGKRFP